jgi:hypothetical protein
MRLALILLPLAALALTACGGTTNRTVVVNPPANSTVVVPEHGQPVVEPH